MSTLPPPVSDRYRLVIRTRHGWSTARQSYASHRRAKEAALWLLAQTGVATVHITAGPDVVTRLTKHEAANPRRKPR